MGILGSLFGLGSPTDTVGGGADNQSSSIPWWAIALIVILIAGLLFYAGKHLIDKVIK